MGGFSGSGAGRPREDWSDALLHGECRIGGGGVYGQIGHHPIGRATSLLLAASFPYSDHSVPCVRISAPAGYPVRSLVSDIAGLFVRMPSRSSESYDPLNLLQPAH